MSDDDNDNGKPYKVGPYNPPRDKQWKKGCRSPNPRGRPRKPKEGKNPFQTLDRMAATVNSFNDRLLPTRDDKGNPTEKTPEEIAIAILYRKAIKDERPGAMRLYLQISKEARAKEEAFRATVLENALKWRETYLPTFEYHEKMRWRLPEVYPDPRDITINPDGAVTIEGPVDKAGRDNQAELIKLQQSCLEDLRDLHGSKDAHAVRRARKIKRELAKINEALSSRLRRDPSEALKLPPRKIEPEEDEE